MKTAISIPDPLFRNAERLAKRLGISRSELYANAVQKYLAEQDRNHLTQQMNAALDQLKEDELALDPSLQKMQNKVFRGETW